MTLKKNSLSYNKRRLTLLASAVCFSALIVGCNEEKPVVENTNNNTNETIKPVESSVIKTETNANIVAGELAQKVNQAKEDLKSFDIGNVVKKVDNVDLISDSIQVQVRDVYVVDGDTIHAINESGEKVKVRLTGIDAPESGQVLGEESADSLRGCISADTAVLVIQNNNASDKYGRTLAKVESAGINCNQQQVEKGMAYFYEDYSDKLAAGDKELYKQAQGYAQENTMGVWANDLQKPWDYRKENK